MCNSQQRLTPKPRREMQTGTLGQTLTISNNALLVWQSLRFIIIRAIGFLVGNTHFKFSLSVHSRSLASCRTGSDTRVSFSDSGLRRERPSAAFRLWYFRSFGQYV